MVRILEAVPPATENPSALAVNESPLTLVKLGVAEVAMEIVPAPPVIAIFVPCVNVASV